MISRAYRHKVEVYRKTDTLDSNNIATTDYVKVNECLGNLQTLNGNMEIVGDAQMILANHRLFLSKDIEIQQLDHLRIEGKNYTVHLIDNLMQTHQEVMLTDKV